MFLCAALFCWSTSLHVGAFSVWPDEENTLSDEHFVNLDDISMDEVVDLRFSEIQHELYAIEQHRLATEAELPSILETARKRLEAEVATDDDPDYIQYALNAIDSFINDDMPRFFRYPTLISLWAVYEAATTDISKEIRKNVGQSLTIEDLRGDKLDTIKKYYEAVLKFPLVSDEQSVRYLRMLLILRNVLAHGNGRKDAIKQSKWEIIQKWNEPGIGTEYGFLTLSAEFVERIVKVVSASLTDLIERVKKTYD